MNKRVILLILDGWGNGKPYKGNAIQMAHKPNFDALIAKYPSSELRTSGEDVGLPHGQMGNSEVGHMNIGAGRIVYQDLTRIDAAIADGSFFDNAALVGACDAARAGG